MASPQQILTAGESASVEYKRSLSDTRRIVETIAAMATIGGGTVVIGVRDDGEVVGVDLGEGEKERLVQQVLANTDPRVFVDLQDTELDGRRVLMVRVPPGDGPHLAFGRAFYRSGPATVAMTRDEYERRLLDRLRESSGFERRTEPAAQTSDVDEQEVERFVALVTERGRIPAAGGPREVLERLHLVREGRLNVAGTLLFAREPQGPLPQAVIRARSNRGASEDARSVEGPLLRQIEEAVAFVGRNLRVRTERDQLARRELPELPLAAVREAVANAVAHRDYRSTAPIQLRLDDRALEIWNPGHLPPPLTPAALQERHPSIPPNPFVARVLYLAGYIEEWGTGTLRMIEAMRAGGNAPPQFELTGESGVRVTLPLYGATPPGVPQRALDALQRFTPGQPFASREYASAAGVSSRSAQADLSQLQSAGLVHRTGTGRATRWLRR